MTQAYPLAWRDNSQDAWLVEFIKRSGEMRRLDVFPAVRRRAKLKKPHYWSRDMEMFEAAMGALANSKMHPENGFVFEAAPGFAALLCRIAGQTAAEFGPKAAAEAFRRMAEEMDQG